MGSLPVRVGGHRVRPRVVMGLYAPPRPSRRCLVPARARASRPERRYSALRVLWPSTQAAARCEVYSNDENGRAWSGVSTTARRLAELDPSRLRSDAHLQSHLSQFAELSRAKSAPVKPCLATFRLARPTRSTPKSADLDRDWITRLVPTLVAARITARARHDGRRPATAHALQLE